MLCHALTYKQGPPHKLCGDAVSRGISLYQPPFEEFQVLRVDVTQPGSISLPAQKSPMMLVVLESQGTHSLQVSLPARLGALSDLTLIVFASCPGSTAAVASCITW